MEQEEKREKLEDLDVEDLLKPIEYSGDEYFTIGQLSRITGISKNSICHFCNRGTRAGKLKTAKIPPLGDVIVVPATELVEYPFPTKLKNGKRAFLRFDEQGNQRIEYSN